MNEIKEGDEFVVPYPFVRCKAFVYDYDGGAEIDSWKPGTIGRMVGPEDAEEVAHGVGAMTLIVVSLHKPGKYPMRVFFTRKWKNPDGEEFGKGALRMTTVPAFRRRVSGYMYPFTVSEAEPEEVA